MRILLLADINSPHTMKWVRGLCDSGMSVGLFSLRSSQTDWYQNLDNFTLLYEANSSRNSDSILVKLGYLSKLVALRKAIGKFNPDIVHAHYASSYGLMGRLAQPKKLFISIWGSDVFEFPKKSRMNKRLFQWILKGADRLFSTSRVMAKEIGNYSTKEVTVIPFGIDPNRFKKKVVKKPSEIFTVGTIKSLEEVYGIDRLIRSFALFYASFPQSECRIYGKGSKESELKRLVEDLQLQGIVKFMGYIDHDRVPEVLSEMDVFCVLSRSESFGVAVIEASACEIPVIATKVGGLPEVVVDQKTGFLVDQNEIEIAEKLQLLASNPSLREELGENGRSFVRQNYDWENNLKLMLEAYRK